VRLIVIRHGETTYNVEDRLTGQSDIPLSSLGEQQANAVAAYLATEKLDVIVSSDLQRARRTAEAIAHYHGLTVEQDSLLREWSLGTWEGRTMAEIRVSEPDLVQRRIADPFTYVPEGGETLQQFHDRVVLALERWTTRYPDSTVVWVAHAGIIGVLICHVLEIDLRRRWQFRHDNASVTELNIIGSRVTLVRLNETAFLGEHHVVHV
jgi:broad specificity phosphatase PhoE